MATPTNKQKSEKEQEKGYCFGWDFGGDIQGNYKIISKMMH